MYSFVIEVVIISWLCSPVYVRVYLYMRTILYNIISLLHIRYTSHTSPLVARALLLLSQYRPEGRFLVKHRCQQSFPISLFLVNNNQRPVVIKDGSFQTIFDQATKSKCLILLIVIFLGLKSLGGDRVILFLHFIISYPLLFHHFISVTISPPLLFHLISVTISSFHLRYYFIFSYPLLFHHFISVTISFHIRYYFIISYLLLFHQPVCVG